MIVYVESSAVLAWLLGESAAPRVREILTAADHVVTSALTGVECARSLTRAKLTGRITATQELAAQQLYDRAERSWDVSGLTERILNKARAPLPNDPVRTLDALHVVSASVLQDALGPLVMLSLDDRVRGCAATLGLDVLPETM